MACVSSTSCLTLNANAKLKPYSTSSSISNSVQFSYLHLSSGLFNLKKTNKSLSSYQKLLKNVNFTVSMSSSERNESISVTSENPSTPSEAINLGLALFKSGKISNALSLFDNALELNPNEEEAQAALFNKACCHAARNEGVEAQNALREALAKYDLRFSVILSDPDLAPFRAMKEFRQLQTEARDGNAEVGSSFRRDLKLISEVRAPYRGVRKFIYVALTMAAGTSTFFTFPRVIQAFAGGEGAPSILETCTNLLINIGGGAVLVWLFFWESRKEEEMLKKISRDETLSRLPLRLSTNRIVELNALRDNNRPVIIAGTKDRVEKCIQQAQRYRNQLLERGVLIVPLIWQTSLKASGSLPEAKGFGEKKPKKSISDLDDFEGKALDAAAKRVSEVERRFKAEPVSSGEWEQWVIEQQESEGVKAGEDVFIVLRLDGRVRKSGLGTPDWGDLVNELPKLDALVSKLER